MPYTPEESKVVLRHLYQVYGENLWGPYGFYDAFNPDENWFADSYLAIDQGPIINMIENYRSGILWLSFMSNPEIDPALTAIGFTEDITSTDDNHSKKFTWTLYPTISDGHLAINIDQENQNVQWSIDIIDALGKKIPFHKYSTNGFQFAVNVDESFSGWAWVFITDNFHFSEAKSVWIN